MGILIHWLSLEEVITIRQYNRIMVRRVSSEFKFYLPTSFLPTLFSLSFANDFKDKVQDFMEFSAGSFCSDYPFPELFRIS